MKKLYLFTLLSALILSGCKSDFEQFNEQAMSYASDKKIEQKEYEDLLELVSVSVDNKFQILKNDSGNIDNAKVLSYLLKYFKAKKSELAEANIWQPPVVASKNDLFNINVYLENSASMDGYVKGVTEFETAIYNLLGDFKISGICDSLNLSYINKSIPYSKKNALAPDIQDFIEKLEPSTFRQRGGDRSVSDLKNILSTVLKSVNEKNAAVLISDFVFSPGSKTNAQDYLNNQGVGIKIDFAEKLKTFDLSAVVIQLQSGFDGLYYDKMDNPIPINCKRPYYIWIIGSTKQISEILNKKMLDNIKGGYQNRLVFQSIKATTETPFKIQSRAICGSFDREELANKIISGASLSKENQTKGLFGFSLAVDFSKSLQDANYFLDTANYTWSNKKYNLKVETITNNSDASLSGFTHLLKLQTTEIREEALRIDVVGSTPSWVYSSTSFEDANIAKDESEKQKTFGLKFLLEGVNDAFYPKSNSNLINSLTITIKK